MRVTTPFLDTLEENIRNNKAPSLSQLIEEIKPKDIPRGLLARYANLLRRLGGLKFAVKILNPIVRSRNSNPTSQEKLEYASCLTRLHLGEESIELLEQLKHENNSEVHFELAAAHISQWDYERAIPHLKAFLQHASIPAYRKVVGELNLGAALIYTNRTRDAEKLLLKVYNTATKEGFHLLVGNVCDLLSEIAITKREFRTALTYIKKAKEILKKSSSRYDLFVDRKYLIIKLMSHGATDEALREFSVLRKKAATLKEWNSIRELEIFRAIASRDLEKLLFVFYGTSHEQLRKRIENLWGQPIPPAKYYDRKIGPKPHKKNHIFDVTLGRDLATGARLKPGQYLHRLVRALAGEVHFPYPTSKLFSLVFQGLKYNPETSAPQVYGIINRLNYWFEENKIPLGVVASPGGYRLRSNKGYTLRIESKHTVTDKTADKINEFIFRLQETRINSGFTANMAMTALKTSKRSTIRLLTEAVNAGLLTRQGSTNLTRYFFVSK